MQKIDTKIGDPHIRRDGNHRVFDLELESATIYWDWGTGRNQNFLPKTNRGNHYESVGTSKTSLRSFYVLITRLL